MQRSKQSFAQESGKVFNDQKTAQCTRFMHACVATSVTGFVAQTCENQMGERCFDKHESSGVVQEKGAIWD